MGLVVAVQEKVEQSAEPWWQQQPPDILQCCHPLKVTQAANLGLQDSLLTVEILDFPVLFPSLSLCKMALIYIMVSSREFKF